MGTTKTMKKLLLTAALGLVALTPAHAGVLPITTGCDPSGNFCLESPDGDDLKMFIDKPKSRTNATIFGSVGTNDNGLDDIGISAGTGLVTDGSGFANIKPAKDTALESVTFAPLIGSYDGFFTSVQLQDNTPKCAKGVKNCDTAVGQFFITVNGDATFEFNQGFDTNVLGNGFDEALNGLGGQINSVTVWIDTTNNPDVSFKELKQVMWSPCGDASGDCGIGVGGNGGVPGGVPETSTWAMGLIGFGAIAGFAAFNRRKAARYVEV
jgi:hypothetical protein